MFGSEFESNETDLIQGFLLLVKNIYTILKRIDFKSLKIIIYNFNRNKYYFKYIYHKHIHLSDFIG